MLSNDNIRTINRQIASELRTASGFCTSDEDKTAALERVAQLKSLLTEQPTRQDIIRELAVALTEQPQIPTRTPAESILDIIAAATRR